MRLIGKKRLEKFRRKNKGNTPLSIEIDRLINEIEKSNWKNQIELKAVRKDADCVHSNGFYFFNISIHRTMILFEFCDYAEATVIWAGSHEEYESTFKNNKNTIKRWLKSNGWI